MTIRQWLSGIVYLAGYKLAKLIHKDGGMALVKHRARKRHDRGAG